MSKKFLLIGVLVSMAAAQRLPGPGKRYAFLVGNAAYQKLPRLPVARDEANAVHGALQRAGFEVTRKDDAARAQFFPELTAFLDKLQPNDICFFYFSGYAVQSAESEDNYLLPVDFNPADDSPMDSRTLTMGVIQQRIEQRQATVRKIFMLEAPRRIEVPVRGATAGLRYPALEESHETIFAFAALPGQVIAPQREGLGLFTSRVIANIDKPGTTIRDVFEGAKAEVARTTEGKQIPLVADNLVAGGFYFHEPVIVEQKPIIKEVIKEVTKVAPLTPGTPASNRRDHEDYVWVPAGNFQMGCAEKDQKCLPNENPRHEVKINKGFWMGRNEVQVLSYKRYVEVEKKTNPKLDMPSGPLEDRRWNKDTNPMVNVTWERAQAYCAWAGGRLPTEAEWEYAARAGENSIYPFQGQDSRDKANFEGKSGADLFAGVAPVHSFTPNAWGLHDMAGNVWEWVNDYYSPTYFREAGAASDPQGPAAGKEHVIRGGSFDSDAESHLRISIRKGFGGAGNSLGFRCVLNDTPDTNKLLGR